LKYVLAIFISLLCYTPLYSEEVPEQLFSQQDVRCLELNIHHEARGEPLAGKKAVALVTLNRAKSGKFPSDVCSVVYQKYQFSWTAYVPKNTKLKVDPHITEIAIAALSNKYKDFTRGALYFHNGTVESFKRREVTRIGNHIFYI
jgi:N-acetylmuramoyl-L-alanine amidase